MQGMLSQATFSDLGIISTHWAADVLVPNKFQAINNGNSTDATISQESFYATVNSLIQDAPNPQT